MDSAYQDFIQSKHLRVAPSGFDPLDISAPLFPFQKHCVRWAIELGRAALFLDTGLGKTRCQVEWARQVAEHTGGRVLILAPLAVSQQTVREAASIGIVVTYCKEQADIGDARIVITNYERMGKFDHSQWAGVVLDESSILKSYSGTMKSQILDSFKNTPYKLACTATPAPNDHLELGNHAEFLGVLSSNEMISRWFINDTSQFGCYRLKGHARVPFWNWVSSWAAMAQLPSDLGTFDDTGYVLPELRSISHVVDVETERDDDAGTLFRMIEMSATSLHKEKRRTAEARARKVAELVKAEPSEQWLVWCETDYEADALTEALPNAVEVRGSDSLEAKEKSLMGFVDGDVRTLITKAKIAGYGLNLQGCARVAFVGATYSFESYYQSIRRVWRFGQKRPVDVHVVMASTERAIWDALMDKRAEFDSMHAHMFEASRRSKQERADAGTYNATIKMQLPTWLRGKRTCNAK